MKHYTPINVILLTVFVFSVVGTPCFAQPPSVAADPLVRMPGTQPADGVNLEAPTRCLNCHAGYNPSVEPGYNWKGSMMAQAARDFLFYACATVAAQDSIAVLGRPNAVDLCERCHFPKGWLEGRSDPPNASLMTGADFDGVQCDVCHRMYDPFFDTTFSGERESMDWLTYWDETLLSNTPSDTAAAETYLADAADASTVTNFNGTLAYINNLPFSAQYTENGSGQFYVSANAAKRASFADAAARHQMLYSRYHKSKYMCGTCHDVSNPALANLAYDGTPPGDGTTVLPSEALSASSYFHVERTFSEFMLSAYGQQGGAPGIGPFAPDVYTTSLANNNIARCQDCHMRDVVGQGCNKQGVPIRPTESIEHPNSGQPLHDLTGGNAFVSYVLASAIAGSPNYDATNDALLNQGPQVLTLDLTQGEGIDPVALLAGTDRALQQLQLAASIDEVQYDAVTGALSFRVQNRTGHKLISGFPEGRRMFVNVKAYAGGTLVWEVNPYDTTVGTLKGLPAPYSHSSPALGANEAYLDELVYEMHPTSPGITGETETFHFVLATGRYKDNRIPPKGFQIDGAAARLVDPIVQGDAAPDYFTAEEYAGGYDAVNVALPVGVDSVEIGLYYQTTSREYVEFLRDEINGTAGRTTLPAEAYVAQTDPFFDSLRAWGDTIWQLWEHNMNIPGAAPVMIASASVGTVPSGCQGPVPTLLAAEPSHSQVQLFWSDEHTADASVSGYNVYYDQGGKAQLLATVGLVTSYTDSNLTDGQEYCYKVTSVTSDCESDFSNVLCAVPNSNVSLQAGVGQLETGRYDTVGKGKGATTVFTSTTTFVAGDAVVVRSLVVDSATGLPLSGVTVSLTISGPETATITTKQSDGSGVAEGTWATTAPNKSGRGGTTPGTYVATVTGLSGNGYVWNGVPVEVSFSVQ